MTGPLVRCHRCGWQADPDTKVVGRAALIVEHDAEHDAADAEIAAPADNVACFGVATGEELAARLATFGPGKAAAVRLGAEMARGAGVTAHVRAVVRGGAVVADVDGRLHGWAATSDPARDLLRLLRALGVRPVDPVDLTRDRTWTSALVPIRARSPRTDRHRRAVARRAIPNGALHPVAQRP